MNNIIKDKIYNQSHSEFDERYTDSGSDGQGAGAEYAGPEAIMSLDEYVKIVSILKRKSLVPEDFDGSCTPDLLPFPETYKPLIWERKYKGLEITQVRVYSETQSNIDIVVLKNAFEDLLYALGCIVIEEPSEFIGSWYKEWITIAGKAATLLQFKERLEKAERAAELVYIDGPQSAVDEKLISAVSNLLKSVENIPTVAFQIGSILLVKTTCAQSGPTVKIRTLQQSEMAFIAQNPEVLWSPQDVLEKLSRQTRQTRKSTARRRQDLQQGEVAMSKATVPHE